MHSFQFIKPKSIDNLFPLVGMLLENSFMIV